MRVLVISHNVFCNSTSMGKTLSGYFKDFKSDELAQFYIHSEIPTSNVCNNYYRITDKEIIKSVFTRKSGKIFEKPDIILDSINVRTDKGITAKLYQKARRRAPLIYILRNMWWSLGAWNTKKLNQWIDSFNPDCVFFASGDYAFMYKIARKIAKKKNLPLIVSCMDDYYFNNRNEGRVLGKLTHSFFMKQVRKTMNYASAILTICDKMAEDYQKLFSKPCHVIHTTTSIKEPLEFTKKKKISYIGNIGLLRDKQLLDIASVLQKLEFEGCPKYIDVYSPESRPEILCNLTEENGIRFHGKVSAEEVLQIMGESLAVIHTESFDPTMRNRVRYSVSTKIADSLASGTPILAYGPSEVASISYLRENNAAFCASELSELKNSMTELVLSEVKRKEITKNAIELAKANHMINDVQNIVNKILK